MFSSDLSFTFKLFFLIPRKQVLDLVKLDTQDQVIIINVPCAMYLLEENKCIDYDIYAGWKAYMSGICMQFQEY